MIFSKTGLVTFSGTNFKTIATDGTAVKSILYFPSTNPFVRLKFPPINSPSELPSLIKGIWLGNYEHESGITLEKILLDVIENDYTFPIIFVRLKFPPINSPSELPSLIVLYPLFSLPISKLPSTNLFMISYETK